VLLTRGARILDRRAGVLRLVGEAALPFGDVLQLHGVLFEAVDATALVDRPFGFVEQAFEIHRVSFRSGLRA
jgi:hypothetical protein